MRGAFAGYYPPTEDELEALWNEGTIVFDTNALLGLFRYSEDTRNEFFELLESSKEQLWIPHHVGLEFHRRRHDVVHEQSVAFDELSRTIDAALRSIESTISKHRRHPSIAAGRLNELVTEKLSDLTAAVDESRSTYERDVDREGVNDQTLERITALFPEVGAEYAIDELEKLEKEGAKRYEAKVPPGYKDAAKDNGNRYGDFIIWSQVLDHVKASPRPLIFVTDDQKEDWWLIVHGKTKGPRPELIQEFANTCGERLHLYSSESFLRVARERRNQAVRESAVREVEEVVSAQQRHRSLSDAINEHIALGRSKPLSAQQLEHLFTHGQPTLADLLVPQRDALYGPLPRLRERLKYVEDLLENYDSEVGGDFYDNASIFDLSRERDMLKARESQILQERRIMQAARPFDIIVDPETGEELEE